MTTYNFKSIFAWNIILYNGFLALSAVYIWTMMDRKVKQFYKVAGVAAFTWRLILTTGTGSIFGFLVARDFYNSAVMAPLFIVMSFAMGLSVFILVLHFAYSWTGRQLGDVVMNRLRYLLAAFIGGVLLIEGARHLTGLYIAQKAGVENFILFDGGIYTQLFWVGQILLGSLLPLSLIFCRKLTNNRAALLLAALFTIVGGFAQLYVILIGGQAYPLTLFPGAEVSSDYFDGAINSYIPTIWELMLGLGGVALALTLVTIGVKVLRFLPDSLSDAVADPHSK
jgi:molybdopterin-containing oxidoreductase family membrane subunit